MPSDPARSDAPRLGLAWRDGAAIAGFCVVLAALAAWQVARERRRVSQAWCAQLTATAASHERQIDAWLAERQADGRVVASFPSVVEVLQGEPHALREAGAVPDAAHLLDVLEGMRTPYRYASLTLFDRRGGEVARVGEPAPAPAAMADAAQDAMTREAQDVRDLVGVEGTVQFAFSTPVVARPADGGAVIGAVVAVVDSRVSVLNLIAEAEDGTPAPETLVVRRQGESVVLLSSSRQSSGPPSVHVPLAEASQAIGAALAGEEGCEEFVGSGGARVLAATRYVEALGWGVVRRIDSREAFAAFWQEAWQIASSAALAALAFSGFALAGARRRRARVLAQELAHERELRGARARYRALSEYANDSALFLAPDGRILEANLSAEVAYGYRHDQLLRMRWRDLHPPAGWADADEHLRRALVTPLVFETINQRRDGTTFPVEVSAVGADVGDERVVVSIIRDISERAVVMAQLRASEQRYRQLSAELERRVEARTAALAAANAELTAFNYSVSHDLRAPLRHISGFIHILQREFADQLPEAARAYLERIASGSRRMGQLIEALLALSRVGRAEMRPAAIDLGALARASFEEMRPADRPVELVLGALPTVTGDPALIRQLFDNLLGNAVKFTGGQSAPRIEVGVRRDGGEDVFCVRDNGVGFDAAHADRLFRVFSRLHGETEFEGTGIGLSIVRRIVERHGGRVWAESEPGRGAAFFFTLGAVAMPEQAQA